VTVALGLFSAKGAIHHEAWGNAPGLISGARLIIIRATRGIAARFQGWLGRCPRLIMKSRLWR